MSEKVIGYLLLTAGIIFIVFSTYSVYSVFAKKAKPIDLFSYTGISIDPNQFIPQMSIPSQITLPDGTIQELETPSVKNQAQKTEIISGDMLNDYSNIVAHLMLMGFLATIGFKLASLGISLIRPIVVRLKLKEVTFTEQEKV